MDGNQVRNIPAENWFLRINGTTQRNIDWFDTAEQEYDKALASARELYKKYSQRLGGRLMHRSDRRIVEFRETY